MLGKNYSRRHYETYLLIFPEKKILTFHANCLLLYEMWKFFLFCFCFSFFLRKIKKNILSFVVCWINQEIGKDKYPWVFYKQDTWRQILFQTLVLYIYLACFNLNYHNHICSGRNFLFINLFSFFFLSLFILFYITSFIFLLFVRKVRLDSLCEPIHIHYENMPSQMYR